MGIILKKLSFGNMFSYGENNTIDLNAGPITQLTAPNGSGKTSIALILQELLYSKNIKSIKKSDILNRYSNRKSWGAKLKFEVDEKEYKIEVQRQGATSKVKLLCDGKDISEHKIPDTYKKLRDILGMDFEIFSQLTYQSSTDLLDFIKATDTSRKKFLINLFNLQRYIEIGDVVKTKIVENEKELTRLKGELDGVVRFLQDTRIEELRKLKEVPIVSEDLLETSKQLGIELQGHKDLCSKIDKNNFNIQERSSLEFDVGLQKPDDSNIRRLENIKYGIDTNIIEFHTRIKEIDKQLKGLNLRDICYACHRPLDITHALEIKESLISEKKIITTALEKLNSDVHNYDILVQDYNQKYKEWGINKKNIERFEQMSQIIDSNIPTEYPNYSLMEKELRHVDSGIVSQSRTREDAIKHNEAVKFHNVKVETLKEQKRQFMARQELVNDDIITIKDKIKNLNILKKAFSTTGIVAFKLENLAKELEDSINKYLIELSDGQFQVVFRLTGEKLNIVVINNGKETPIETVSGGEFSRIQTAILLAIRNVLSKIGGNYVNLLFLDEILGVLDSAGKEKLLDILTEEMRLNVFLISHDFNHPLIHKISIIKENNISSIE